MIAVADSSPLIYPAALSDLDNGGRRNSNHPAERSSAIGGRNTACQLAMLGRKYVFHAVNEELLQGSDIGAILEFGSVK